MNLLDNENKARFYLCPRCQQFISVKVNKCRYCLLSIPDVDKIKAVQAQQNIEESYHTNINKNILRIGWETLIFGFCCLLFCLFTLFLVGRISIVIAVLAPITILIGLNYIFSSIYGIYRKKR